MDEGDINVQDNAEEHRYEVYVDGALAGYSAYRDEPGRRVITHTKIDDDFEGQGVGSALARAALDDVRSKNLTVVPRCPFIAGYIARHPSYADLVAP